MSLRDKNLRIALLKAFVDAIEDELKRERETHRDELVTRYDDEGTKSFDVKLPDGVKVATISLSIPKASTEISDGDALMAWAKENAPELLTVVEHPGTPAVRVPAKPPWTEHQFNLREVNALIDRLEPVDSANPGPVVDPDTGQIVDGVTHTPAAAPKSYSVRYTDTGRADLARAYRSGALGEVVAGTPLAIIGGQS